MHRPSPLGTAAALAAFCVILIGPSAASAAPTAGFVVQGDADQSLSAVAPGANGSVWVQQQVSGGAQLKRYSASGELEATSSGAALPTGPIATATDGSAWTLAGSNFYRVAPDGSTSSFALPDGMWFYKEKLTLDADSDAWGLACQPSSDEPDIHPQYTCSAVKVTPAGAVSTIPLADFDYGLDFLVSSTSDLDIFAVPGGVWIDRTIWVHEWHAGASATAFVSDSGAVTPIDLGGNARLVAPAPNGKAWWMRWSEPSNSSDAPVLTFGQATQDANVLPASDPISGDFNTTPPILASNAAGALLFALNRTPTASWIGSFSGSSATVHSAPATETVIDPGNLCAPFAGYKTACNYGKSIFQTADGAIWTLAAPDEMQVGRLAADGTWTRFSPLTGSTENLTVSGMTQASDGAIWFALDKADGTHVISRADPSDPPADETPAPPADPTGSTGSAGTGGSTGQSNGVSVTGKSVNVPTDAASASELTAVATAVRKATKKWRKGKFSSKITVPFPRDGRLDVTVASGQLVMAKLAKSRGSGSHLLTLKVGTAGRILLKLHRTFKITITTVFSAAGHKQASSKLSFRL